ncbi:hypothetical protein ATK74_0434 [Propionicimonas paludicola]|uniref:Uncharacterized protein n=1 Tax=Propionicimonas paludicola TaxID=185243 RepID=A0A2A9CNE4_9ACTN|nr:hypothetical protein [Propionicimonas paludicola]PFG15913.1 hypothetical protein ATK74_0434 [Propionicimonas paludicola]
MIENIKRFREPFTWAVTAVLLGGLVLGVVQIWLQVASGAPLLGTLQSLGGNLMNLTVVFALVGLVCTCLFAAPATRDALLVTRVAAGVVSLGVLLTLVANLLGLFAGTGTLDIAMDLIGGLLDLVLKALAAGALWLLARGVSAGRIEPAAELVAGEDQSDPATPSAPTTWRREEAVGTAWGSAAEAASGQPGKPQLKPDPPVSAE